MVVQDEDSKSSAVRNELQTVPETATTPKLQKLPVDEHRSQILNSVRRNRITIIQGGTGCGKSSRIPIMLLENNKSAKLFISQPRRIAAKGLVERLRDIQPEFRNQISLRMGHGVREYETDETRAWFVTTGYIVRLLANHPERFNNIDYLIVDEVHERSVDTDILCLLCRRLLDLNPNIRLILMSATMSADMYREYFGVKQKPIVVGARRFPVEEVYLEEILKMKLPKKEKKAVTELLTEGQKMKCSRAPSVSGMERLYTVAAHLATVVAKPGTSVLVFVAGMNDIVAITEIIEKVEVPGTTFRCLPIHSDIPFEDQLEVFKPPEENEVKIVVATNAAESSVTLPDVDNVICLGVCKQIVYNPSSHRQILSAAWISKASATQRAGRTGRVRNGTVYRLYPRETFAVHMSSFEPGEMVRIPLDSVILMLKEMLPDEEGVSETLMSCIEPPSFETIENSLVSLHTAHFTTSPDDDCLITTLGSFVSALGIDLLLGSLIGLGIQFGVGPEAIQLAAILSVPKSPWLMSNPLVHSVKEYNGKL